MLTSWLIGACSAGSGVVGKTPNEVAVAAFVQQTINLELQGVRWKELVELATPQTYYSRFVWKPEVEPGWDVLTISEAFTVDRVTSVASRTWDELKPNGDVRERVTPGYEAMVTFENLYQLTREGYQTSADEHLRLFVVEIAGGYLITDRLHPPHFGVRAADDVLRTPPYSAAVFEKLRAAIRQQLNDKR